MSRHVRSQADRLSGRDKRRRQLPLLDAIVSAFEVDLLTATPERIANRKKLFGPQVTLVVRKIVAVTALLLTRAARDDVE